MAEHDAQGFDRMVEPHRPALRAYVLQLTKGDEVTAGAVVKETLYRMATDPERYLRRPQALWQWLVLTAGTVLREFAHEATPGHAGQAGPGVFASPPTAAVAAAVATLPAAHRELIADLVHRKVPLAAAAQRRGVPVEQLKSELYAAMQALRAAVTAAR